MLTTVRRRFTSAHLMGAVAIFIALGGTALAVKNGSIGPKKLKTNAVRTKKIADGAVTTPKLADGAVTGAKADESTFDKVPLAAAADTATNAQNAVQAANATNAQNAVQAANATNAQNAVHAANADQALNSDKLGGFGPIDIRPDTNTRSTGTDKVLDADGEVVIQTELPANIPPGGANVIVSASLDLVTTAGAFAEASCQVHVDPGDATFGQIATVNFPDIINWDVQVPVLADFNDLGGNSDTISVVCSATNNVKFDRGNLAVVVYPTAAL